MRYITNKKYCSSLQCEKKLWMDLFRPEKKTIDKEAEYKDNCKKEISDKAMELFGNYVNTMVYNNDGSINFEKSCERTCDEISNGTVIIRNAVLSFERFYCLIDVLKKEDYGYDIYEIKTSADRSDGTTQMKDDYFIEASYQEYILNKLGLKTRKIFVVRLNSKYHLHGSVDTKSLFTITDITNEVSGRLPCVKNKLLAASKIVDLTDCPCVCVSEKCSKPHKCEYLEYCVSNLPKNNIFDLYEIGFKEAIKCFKENIITFEDYEKASEKLTQYQKNQIEYVKGGTYINKDEIKAFLKRITYPCYFLDFESISPAIPKFEGSSPYSHVVFQYSLHFVLRENGELYHKEFIAEPGVDPRRSVAESLCMNVPENSCVVVYNKGFEGTRIKEMADLFPYLQDHLMSIHDSIVDLQVPFQKGYYYTHSMGKSNSLKSVVPALFPGSKELCYTSLSGVHNGNEAMNVFSEMENYSKEEQEKIKKELLMYCSIDTLALVRIIEKLIESVK